MILSRYKVIVAAVSICADFFTFWNGTSNNFTYVRMGFALLVILWVLIPSRFSKPDIWYVSLFLGLILLLGAGLSLLAVVLKASAADKFNYAEFLTIGILYLIGGIICVLPTSKEKVDN